MTEEPKEADDLKAELAEAQEHGGSRSQLVKSWVRYGDRVSARAQKWREDLAAALGIEPDARGDLPNVDELIEKAAEMRAVPGGISMPEEISIPKEELARLRESFAIVCASADRRQVELEQATGERDAARVTFDWLDKGSKEKDAKLTEELNEARAGLVKVMTDNDAQMATVKTYYQRRTENLTKAREVRDELLRQMYLYTDWKYVTKQLTTEEKELWADIIDAGTVPGEEFIPVDRWWRK